MVSRFRDFSLFEVSEPHAAQCFEVARLQAKHGGPFVGGFRAITRFEVKQREQCVRFDMRRVVFHAAHTELDGQIASAEAAVGAGKREEC
jgi:hypothetical protein